MTDEVAALVLADNSAQANALEIAAVEAAELVGVHAADGTARAAATSTARWRLSPRPRSSRSAMPPGWDSLHPNWRCCWPSPSSSWTRLVESDVPDDPYLHEDLVGYFPVEVRGDLGGAIDDHPLRREIVATVVANAVVNRAGITFLSRLNDETGIAPRC